jgi:uncharacterized protein DUF973/zinc ribbon protein
VSTRAAERVRPPTESREWDQAVRRRAPALPDQSKGIAFKWKRLLSSPMTARFCPFCGRPVVANATFCASCGAAIAGAPPPASPTGYAPSSPLPGPAPYAPYTGAYAPSGRPTPASSAADRSALSSVVLAAVLGLIGAVLSFAELFTRASSFVAVSGAGSGTSFSLDASALYLLAALGAAGLVFALLELSFYRRAFGALTPQDNRFSTPSKLVLTAITALVLLVLVVVAIFAVIYQAIQCAGSGNPITTACISPGELLGLIGIGLILVIVLVVGYIGLLIGIWRLGTRYDEPLFKVGAVLLIFPVLNIVALVLILVGARSARDKLGTYSPPLTFS